MCAVDVQADIAAVDGMLALNNTYPDELAIIDRAALTRLVAMSFRTRRIGSIDAFVIALDQTASYDSPNFGWFRARHDRFVYVDRIVVDPAARGHGYARALYSDLFAAARAAGQERIVCEVTARPPNPVSDAFHAALGFRAVGLAEILGGKKTVRYLERDLDDW